MSLSTTTVQGRRSDLPLAAVASTEVARLRAVRDDLMHRRAAVDRELKTVNDLIATYVSFQPALGLGGAQHGRARRLGATLAEVLAGHPDEWLDLETLRREALLRLPGIELNTVRLRNALYHLVKTDRAGSHQTDNGIQYACLSSPNGTS